MRVKYLYQEHNAVMNVLNPDRSIQSPARCLYSRNGLKPLLDHEQSYPEDVKSKLTFYQKLL